MDQQTCCWWEKIIPHYAQINKSTHNYVKNCFICNVNHCHDVLSRFVCYSQTERQVVKVMQCYHWFHFCVSKSWWLLRNSLILCWSFQPSVESLWLSFLFLAGSNWIMIVFLLIVQWARFTFLRTLAENFWLSPSSVRCTKGWIDCGWFRVQDTLMMDILCCCD